MRLLKSTFLSFDRKSSLNFALYLASSILPTLPILWGLLLKTLTKDTDSPLMCFWKILCPNKTGRRLLEIEVLPAHVKGYVELSLPCFFIVPPRKQIYQEPTLARLLQLS
uniref:Uncharacterized protein n=1 Tax=Bionectria ochroleuca TaxID=29856 RepID=A0A8H7N748_BIOOC